MEATRPTPRPPAPLLGPLFEPPTTAAVHACAVQQWVTDYLCRPHQDLGRDGPVCPLTRPSLEKGLFWACYYEQSDMDAEDVRQAVEDVLKLFGDLSPVAGPDAVLAAVLIVFPNLRDYDAIDEAQRQLKSSFVSQGLMLGQFYPGCAEPGLWNRDFRPLSAPMPMLAIRHMVSNDFPFLDNRVEWIEAYLRRFAPSIPAPVRESLAVRLTPSAARS
jgi:hypothetical protein